MIGETEVIEYLTAHPEFLVEYPEFVQRAAALRQAAIDEQEVARRRALIDAEADLLFRSEWTPVLGDAAAVDTLIEFSDYQCAPCRTAYPEIESFVRNTRGLRFVRLQLPVYGPWSTVAARAALLAQRLGDFEAFHRAMMMSQGPVDLDAIESALGSAGVAAEVFASRMDDAELTNHLDRIREFSIAANVLGTPAYLLNGVLLNGAVTEADLVAAATRSGPGSD